MVVRVVRSTPFLSWVRLFIAIAGFRDVPGIPHTEFLVCRQDLGCVYSLFEPYLWYY